MTRRLYALCAACALAIAGACEGTETGNPDPSRELDAGSVHDSDSDGGAPHRVDASVPPPRDAGSSADAGGAVDAGAAMDAAADDDAGP